MNDKFTCRHCRTERGVYRENGRLRLEPHTVAEPDSLIRYRCEGCDGWAEDNVVEIVRLRELENPKRPTTQIIGKTAPDEQDDAIQRRFEQYHEKNPQVLVALTEIAMRMKEEGRQRLSISELFEILRYHKRMQVDSTDQFKFSNDYRSRYVRLMVKIFPELSGLFELRELRSVNGKQPV